MRGLQPSERGDHRVRLVTNSSITAHQIRIHVGEPRASPIEQAAGVKIEEHSAAAEERLDVPIERRRVVSGESVEELAFTASPFQQRSCRWKERGSHGHVYYRSSGSLTPALSRSLVTDRSTGPRCCGVKALDDAVASGRLGLVQPAIGGREHLFEAVVETKTG